MGRWGRGGRPLAEPAALRAAHGLVDGVHRPSGASRKAAAGAVAAAGIGLLAMSVGCGGGSEVEEGATVDVYAGAPVCAQAKRRLARSGPEVGSVRIRVVCASPSLGAGERGPGARLDLAVTGANARRATEDSSAVAYLEAPGRAVAFIRPILDEAEIRLIPDSSGARGLATVMGALDSRSADESPRESLWVGR